MHLTDQTDLITPTTSETAPSKRRTSEKDKSSNAKFVDTGYDRFVQRHCQWKQLLHILQLSFP
jgi:hypothetical protein